MPALESFDWFRQQVWPVLDEEGRRYLETQRQYLLTLRNEDERRRFVAKVMEQVKEMKKKKA
ncbi:MAG TPA: hypothetical protein VNL36_00460 [Bacteroidota bacterium]|nr:hypothetical protein [Bacteroidota bacterium]